MSDQPTIWAWRHPKPMGVAGRCIGQTDVPIDRRKAKRLAHRIRHMARVHGLPNVIYTSSLQRCRHVGRQLRQWGWQHVVDARLVEAHFGRWDGKPWSQVPHADVDAWVDDFANHAPGGGECLRDVLNRATAWNATQGAKHIMMVAHGGWMLARQWGARHPGLVPLARAWPAPPAYGELWTLT